MTNGARRRRVGPRAAAAVALVALLAVACSPAAADTLIVGTFNIHYTAPWQDRMAWEDRRDAVVAALSDGGFDLMAFQEMETFEGGSYNEENVQLEWIAAHFPDYDFAAVGDPREYPFTQPVLYRRSRFEPLEQGFFFFSPTPDEIYSRSWDGGFPAFCSWVRFRDRRTEATFYLYNLHLDHSSRGNRVKAARLTARRISQRAHPEAPVIVTGDFNAPWFFRPVRIIAESGLQVAETRGSTFHFYRGINILPAIDHVLAAEPFTPQGTRVLRRRYDGTWPSDHYPVLVTLSAAGAGEAQNR